MCPADHTVYLSEQLALNAVALHRIQKPHCGGYRHFRCGDHWHVGHPRRTIGQACREDEEHRAAMLRRGRARQAMEYLYRR